MVLTLLSGLRIDTCWIIGRKFCKNMSFISSFSFTTSPFSLASTSLRYIELMVISDVWKRSMSSAMHLFGVVDVEEAVDVVHGVLVETIGDVEVVITGKIVLK